jgi:hypothetical protein
MSKRALIVGINHFARANWTLRGCVNDTIEMDGLLKTYFGFHPSDIRTMRDQAATTANIHGGLDWLLSDYDGDGSDVRVFHFSSHGTQVEDQNNDEWECKDEVIVTHDHDWDAPFRDDDLWEHFKTVPQNVNFTFIADCCHSGNIQFAAPDIEFRPRYLSPPIEVDDLIRDMRQERDNDLWAYQSAQMAQLMQGVPADQWTAKFEEFLKLTKEQFMAEQGYGIVQFQRHILLAACESSQTAADARIEGEWRGAMSWALSKAIVESNGDLTYEEAISRAAAKLENYDQRPQLECPTELQSLKLFAPLA